MNPKKQKFPDTKQCPFCTGELTTKETKAGKSLRCKQCTFSTVIPLWFVSIVENDKLKDCQDVVLKKQKFFEARSGRKKSL